MARAPGAALGASEAPRPGGARLQQKLRRARPAGPEPARPAIPRRPPGNERDLEHQGRRRADRRPGRRRGDLASRHDLRRGPAEGRKAVHDATYNSAGTRRKGYGDVTDPRSAPGARHELVRTHPESGRKCLFLGRRRNSYVLGLELDESEALLDALWKHATQPQFTWRQEWRVGDVIVWDNRCTLHRRDAFDPRVRRLLHRTQIRA